MKQITKAEFFTLMLARRLVLSKTDTISNQPVEQIVDTYTGPNGFELRRVHVPDATYFVTEGQP